MSYFPTNKEEISLIKFIAKYQYLNVSDAKYFFNSSRYYRNRIKNLIDKDFLRKIRWMLVLGGSGIQYVKLLNFEYNKSNKNAKYREKLKYLHSIRWKAIIDKCYKGAYLSEYSFCEYTNNKDKFINMFFLDTEKITRFKYFIRENSTKRAYIICNSELETKLQKELPEANYCVVDLEKYIDKERKYYYAVDE